MHFCAPQLVISYWWVLRLNIFINRVTKRQVYGDYHRLIKFSCTRLVSFLLPNRVLNLGCYRFRPIFDHLATSWLLLYAFGVREIVFLADSTAPGVMSLQNFGLQIGPFLSLARENRFRSPATASSGLPRWARTSGQTPALEKKLDCRLTIDRNSLSCVSISK